MAPPNVRHHHYCTVVPPMSTIITITSGLVLCLHVNIEKTRDGNNSRKRSTQLYIRFKLRNQWNVWQTQLHSSRSVELADINGECKQKGANSCIEIISLDKRENISITKQLRWFYYMSKEREEFLQVELPTFISLQCLIVPVKCQRKFEVGASNPIHHHGNIW